MLYVVRVCCMSSIGCKVLTTRYHLNSNQTWVPIPLRRVHPFVVSRHAYISALNSLTMFEVNTADLLLDSDQLNSLITNFGEAILRDSHFSNTD